jgi:hypothetical protein
MQCVYVILISVCSIWCSWNLFFTVHRWGGRGIHLQRLADCAVVVFAGNWFEPSAASLWRNVLAVWTIKQTFLTIKRLKVTGADEAAVLFVSVGQHCALFRIPVVSRLSPVARWYRQFNIRQFYVLTIQCVYVFCVDLRTNSDYFPIQH